MNFPITTDVGLSFIIKEKAKLKNRLRHKKISSTGVMSHHFPQVGESRPCRVRTPLMKHLNRTMVGAVTVTLMHHIEIKGGGEAGLRVESIKDDSLIKTPIAD